MDSIKLSNFIVIKSFSDSEKSLLDCVMPFVEYSIAKINTEYIEADNIAEKSYDKAGVKELKEIIKIIVDKTYVLAIVDFKAVAVKQTTMMIKATMPPSNNNRKYDESM